MTTIEVKRIGREEMKILDGMPMIVIYEKPADFPEKYVARLWDISAGQNNPTGIAALADTLDEIRGKIPFQSMFPIKRMPEDDPCIIETWI